MGRVEIPRTHTTVRGSSPGNVQSVTVAVGTPGNRLQRVATFKKKENNVTILKVLCFYARK